MTTSKNDQQHRAVPMTPERRAEAIIAGTGFCMLASCYDRCEPRVLVDPCRV